MAARIRQGWWLTAVAAIIVAGGAAFRSYRAFRNPLWLDEAYSAYAAAGGFRFLWHVVPLYETHPPFYYSLVRLWTLAFGDGLVALRSLGLAAGLLTLPATWWAARGLARLGGLDARRTALAALAFAAFASRLIELSREVRPYAVMALVYAIALGAIFRAVAPLATGGRIARAPFALYCLSAAAMLWLHSLGPFYGLTLGLGALVLVARRGLARADVALFVGGHVAVALAYLPGVLILADQAPTWVRSTWLVFAPDARTPWVIAALWGAEGRATTAVALLLWGVAAASLAMARDGARAAVALLLAAVLPVALSLAVSALVAPVFIARTLVPVGVPSALLLGAALGTPLRRLRWPMLAGGLLILAAMLSADVSLRRHERPRQEWYAAIGWLTPRIRPGDVVLAYPNEGALPFDRAARDRGLALRSRPVPGPVPAFADRPGRVYPTGSRGVVALPQPELEGIARATRAAPTIWLLRLGPWAYDKRDAFLRTLERDRAIGFRFRSGAIDIAGLRRPEDGARATLGRAAPAAAAAAR